MSAAFCSFLGRRQFESLCLLILHECPLYWIHVFCGWEQIYSAWARDEWFSTKKNLGCKACFSPFLIGNFPVCPFSSPSDSKNLWKVLKKVTIQDSNSPILALFLAEDSQETKIWIWKFTQYPGTLHHLNPSINLCVLGDIDVHLTNLWKNIL